MDDKCGGCRKLVRTTQSGLQCSLCKLWYHAKCADASETLVNFLKSEEGQKASIHWYCRACEQGSQKLFEQMVVVDRRLTAVENQLCEIKGSMKSLSQSQQDSSSVVIEKVEEIKNAVASVNERLDGLEGGKMNSGGQGEQDLNRVGTGTRSNELITEVANELRERERRALNVVFAGEVTREKVDLFVQAVGVEAPNNVVEIKTQQKNMLYIVFMKTEREKWSLISKARTISQTKDGLQNIYVNPDLTKTERNNQYLLRPEVRARRQHGEKVKISKGKVIQIPS